MREAGRIVHLLESGVALDAKKALQNMHGNDSCFLCFCFVFTDGLVSQPQPPSCNHHHELVINLGKRRYMLQPNLLKGPICFTLKNLTRVFSMQQHVVIIMKRLAFKSRLALCEVLSPALK